MLRLMNSAMMPDEGTYKCHRIGKVAFINMLNSTEFESYIGYESTANMIKQMGCFKKINISREQTIVQDGDVLLIIKLKYRVGNPNDKRHLEPSEDDFEFFVIQYNT